MSDSVFTRIVKGEIPAHKIYEDERTIAFLDIHPIQPGHTLVVPKAEVDHIWDLSPEDYTALMETVKKVGAHLNEVLHTKRVAVQIVGFDVPHTHVHLVPCNSNDEFHNQPDLRGDPDHDALAKMADRLRME